jgi:hypothetical protein
MPRREKVILVKANASAVFTGRADRKTTIGRAIRWHAFSRFARPAIRDDAHRLIKGAATLLVALLVSTLLSSILFVLPAGAGLSETGPVDPETGFPAWLEDGKRLRLEPCFTYPNCPQDGGESSSVASDQEGEVVYWSATSRISNDDGVKALLAMSTRGDFREGPALTEQRVYNRIRIRADGLVPGATYRVTYPYGTETFTNVAGGQRGIDYTEDIGCLQAPCGGFTSALNGRVGPWLTWTTLASSDDGPPAGYIGYPSKLHEVIGSPVLDSSSEPQNYFKIEGPDVGGPGDDVVRNNLFTLGGKVHGLAVSANPKGGVYDSGSSVTLTSSDPAAKIFYTTDGTEPSALSTPYEGPIQVEAPTTLKFMALGPADEAGNRPRSPISTETYEQGARPRQTAMTS